MFKLFSKKKFPDGKRVILFCGKSIIHYRRKKMPEPESLSISPEFERFGYSVVQDGEIFRITGHGLNLECDSKDSLNEIITVLCRKEYHFDINGPFVMFDIGLNLGFTSLLTAQNEQCVKAYGFEPFGPTFRLAQRNVSLNPEIENKIEIFNFGLSQEEKTLQIAYNPEFLGYMSTFTDRFEEMDQCKKESVILKKASEVLTPLFNKHNEPIFLKIDCEGAEWEIIPELNESGLLDRVSVLIMETHFKPALPLIEILIKAGFKLFCNAVPCIPSENLELIRAIKL